MREMYFSHFSFGGISFFYVLGINRTRKMEELMNRYLAGTLSNEEKAVLFRHLEQDEALKEEYVRLQNIIAVSGMISREGDELWTAINFRKLMRRAGIRRLRPIMKYAAAVLLLIGTWFFTKEYTSKENVPGYILIEAPKGQRAYVTLSDGTEAWLSSRSQLRVPNQFNQTDRVVELNGEGLFSVAKNDRKPFVVRTQQYNVQVTGTQFNVFAYAESALFETDLIDGAVYVFNERRAGDGLCLAPNEKAYDQAGQLLKTASSFTHSHYIKNGVYSFENQPLKDIAQRMELWYDVKIHITKSKIANYTFSGKFRQTDEIGHILKAIKETGKFNYRIIDENQIELF
jgi:ferric-dicitrate binding protein FerR (iron transport regulator)